MRAVDTNVLVRILARDDEEQASRAEAFVEKGAWVSHLVLAETVWVLTTVYDVAPTALAAALEKLLSHRHLTLEDRGTVAAALDQFREHPSLGFSDCLVLEIARKAGHLPLGTFDRKLSRLDGAQTI